MNQVSVFILGLIIGGVAVWFFNKRPAGKESLIEKQAQEKEEHKQKILDLVNGNSKVANNDVEKLLGVSDATAERYLNELEKEGVLKQEGNTGTKVFYSKR